MMWVDGSEKQKAAVTKLIAAFPYAVKRHIRAETSSEELEEFAGHPVFRDLYGAFCLPDVLLQTISYEIVLANHEGRCPGNVANRLDKEITALMDLTGEAHKLCTAVPFAYAIEGSRLIVFFLLSLPFATVNSLGWFCIVATFLIGYAFLSIEQIGTEIEDPFGDDFNDLPIDALCAEFLERINDMSAHRRLLYRKQTDLSKLNKLRKERKHDNDSEYSDDESDVGGEVGARLMAAGVSHHGHDRPGVATRDRIHAKKLAARAAAPAAHRAAAPKRQSPSQRVPRQQAPAQLPPVDEYSDEIDEEDE